MKEMITFEGKIFKRYFALSVRFLENISKQQCGQEMWRINVLWRKQQVANHYPYLIISLWISSPGLSVN
ncbi:hypothetical protein BPOR_0082g00170 [Botrytis porri]|uniref:Uncharacterized protein n=1 Tax=Botrytis porri TaxID=87229 RepID=A0A4Z1KZX2_9HELO|nr:hypothetical protein BPOR_0082g00170 [Botrytis porri]